MVDDVNIDASELKDNAVYKELLALNGHDEFFNELPNDKELPANGENSFDIGELNEVIAPEGFDLFNVDELLGDEMIAPEGVDFVDRGELNEVIAPEGFDLFNVDELLGVEPEGFDLFNGNDLLGDEESVTRLVNQDFEVVNYDAHFEDYNLREFSDLHDTTYHNAARPDTQPLQPLVNHEIPENIPFPDNIPVGHQPQPTIPFSLNQLGPLINHEISENIPVSDHILVGSQPHPPPSPPSSPVQYQPSVSQTSPAQIPAADSYAQHTSSRQTSAANRPGNLPAANDLPNVPAPNNPPNVPAANNQPGPLINHEIPEIIPVSDNILVGSQPYPPPSPPSSPVQHQPSVSQTSPAQIPAADSYAQHTSSPQTSAANRPVNLPAANNLPNVPAPNNPPNVPAANNSPQRRRPNKNWTHEEDLAVYEGFDKLGQNVNLIRSHHLYGTFLKNRSKNAVKQRLCQGKKVAKDRQVHILKLVPPVVQLQLPDLHPHPPPPPPPQPTFHPPPPPPESLLDPGFVEALKHVFSSEFKLVERRIVDVFTKSLQVSNSKVDILETKLDELINFTKSLHESDLKVETKLDEFIKLLKFGETNK